jgi:hypothetical protein
MTKSTTAVTIATATTNNNNNTLQNKKNKLPLAILIHFNYYYSLLFAILIGRVVFTKYTEYYYCNIFQRTLLLPVYSVWLLVEMIRLHVGQKGVLLHDGLTNLATFTVLSIFPQIWIAVYITFLQEIILLPFDSILGMIMLLVLLSEVVLALRFGYSIIN